MVYGWRFTVHGCTISSSCRTIIVILPHNYIILRAQPCHPARSRRITCQIMMGGDLRIATQKPLPCHFEHPPSFRAQREICIFDVAVRSPWADKVILPLPPSKTISLFSGFRPFRAFAFISFVPQPINSTNCLIFAVISAAPMAPTPTAAV